MTLIYATNASSPRHPLYTQVRACLVIAAASDRASIYVRRSTRCPASQV